MTTPHTHTQAHVTCRYHVYVLTYCKLLYWSCTSCLIHTKLKKIHIYKMIQTQLYTLLIYHNIHTSVHSYLFRNTHIHTHTHTHHIHHTYRKNAHYTHTHTFTLHIYHTTYTLIFTSIEKYSNIYTYTHTHKWQTHRRTDSYLFLCDGSVPAGLHLFLEDGLEFVELHDLVHGLLAPQTLLKQPPLVILEEPVQAGQLLLQANHQLVS